MKLAIRENIDPRSQASFSFSNRLFRAIWGGVHLLLFRFSPKPCHRWRAMILKFFGAKLRKGVHVYPDVTIWAPWNLTMEEGACLGPGVECYNIAKVHIGARAIISQGTSLCTGTHDYQDPCFQLLAKPIHIGQEAWVCAQCFIAPGVSVGDRAVIGVRSLCLKDMPEGMVCAGHPCQVIKER